MINFDNNHNDLFDLILNKQSFLIGLIPRSTNPIPGPIESGRIRRSNHNYSSFDYYSFNQYYGMQFYLTIGFYLIWLSNLIIWVSSVQIFIPIWLERSWISVCVKQYPLLCCGCRSLIKRKHWYQSFDVFTVHASIDWIVEWTGKKIINRWILNK